MAVSFTVAKRHQPLTLHLGQGLGGVAALVGGLIEVAHENSDLIVDRPERHQEVLRPGFGLVSNGVKIG